MRLGEGLQNSFLHCVPFSGSTLSFYFYGRAISPRRQSPPFLGHNRTGGCVSSQSPLVSVRGAEQPANYKLLINNMSAFQDGDVQLVVGPRGELQGRWEDWDEAGYGKLRKILITHGKAINSVQMGYEHKNLTTLAYSHRRGGDGDIFDSVR
ncbi:hypothetical protein Taro_054905 [Colocasia esculenta]|uniref:Uncharacterized protein n=1 Tax=Colocasia esculenta TaxID=4460 RepID=A0A843XQ38_COLES|nr:hypothetical protein [Colocasia esculenta]